MMKMKRVGIFILALATVAFFGYLIINTINIAKVKRAYYEHYIKSSYQMQNDAFFGLGQGEYMPYDSIHNTELQIHINVYTRKTGKTVTIDDVKTFLKDQENTDGSPRTWEDDTGIIFDFVYWCADNAMAINDYKGNLQDELTKYNEQYPDCLYDKLSDLNVEQINELDKKLDDPNYELDLENLK